MFLKREVILYSSLYPSLLNKYLLNYSGSSAKPVQMFVSIDSSLGLPICETNLMYNYVYIRVLQKPLYFL